MASNSIDINMPISIYIAGRIARDRTRYGLLEIAKSADDGTQGYEYMNAEPEPFTFDGHACLYTGPFTIGCDHGCAHAWDHAVGPTCGQDIMAPMSLMGHDLKQQLRNAVYQKSKEGIDRANLIFAWLGDDSHQAHGTLVEIGIASAMGKVIVIAHSENDTQETWFAKQAAHHVVVAENPRDALSEALNWYASRPKAPWLT